MMTTSSAASVPKDLPIGYVPVHLLRAVVALSDRLRDSRIEWSLGGDLADVVRGADITPPPDHVEVLTSGEGAASIHEAVREYGPSELGFVEQRLTRSVCVEGKMYPVLVRSYAFDFVIAEALIRVHGDMQFKVGDWEWGDVLQFDPEAVYMLGAKVMIVPVVFNLELYRSLGWTDRANLLTEAIMRAHGHCDL